jgi:fructoselysine-6-P-deglycase FrlB-like protein
MIPGFIREQPDVVERCFATARAFRPPWPLEGLRAIALVGSGSSFNALQTVRQRFLCAKRGPVLVYEPEDFTDDLASGVLEGLLVVILSQSGASATSVAALAASRAAGLPALAVTASAASPLGLQVGQVLVLPIGEEPVGPKTKGFLGSVAALIALAESLGAPPAPSLAVEAIQVLIAPARAAAHALAGELGRVDTIFISGRRAFHGIALEASLKISEMAGIPCAAFPTEELLHGRLHGVTAESLVMMLCGGPDEVAEARRVQAVMVRHGCRVIPVAASGTDWPPGPAGPTAPWDAPALIIPFQWLAVALAEKRGLRPEAMRYGALSRELAIKLQDPR